VLAAIAESLGLDRSHFRSTICRQHLGLLRLFHYPAEENPDPSLWAVGEHTDYGLITLLLPTDKGLQVQTKQGEWIDVDPIPGTFIVNIGDILERITGGLYKSTPHRARNTQGRSRYAIPYFFDPDWDAELKELKLEVSE
jgi:isopenicillin N synthase-like dioxygenase